MYMCVKADLLLFYVKLERVNLKNCTTVKSTCLSTLSCMDIWIERASAKKRSYYLPTRNPTNIEPSSDICGAVNRGLLHCMRCTMCFSAVRRRLRT